MDNPSAGEPEIMIRYGRLDAYARDRVLDQFYLTYHGGVPISASKTFTVLAAFLAIAGPAAFLAAQIANLLHMTPYDAIILMYATVVVVECTFFGYLFSNRAKTRYKERWLQTSELGMTPSRLLLHTRNIHGGFVKRAIRWMDVSSISVYEDVEGTHIELVNINGKKTDLCVDCIQTIEERQILRHFLLSKLPALDVSAASAALTKVGRANDVPFTKLWSQALQDSRPRVRTNVLPADTTLLNGTYLVQSLIASGGQGAVYQASMRTVEGSKTVVLKEYVLPDMVHEAEHKAAVEQFEHEVRLLSKIEHPGVIRMHDAFVEDHRAYLVLDKIEGVSLKDYVTTHGALPESRAIKLAVQMCDILAMLHSQTPSVMHLDFSPDNMLIDNNDHLTTIDFNVSIEENAIRTRTVMGKQRYMAPEQYRGKPTQRSDIYALGASLYFVLTGIEPHPISVARPAKDNPSVSEALSALVAKATALEESDRYQSASEIQKALEDMECKLIQSFA